PAPKIAIDYWRLPADAKLLDVIYATFERSESEQYLKETHNVLREQHEAHPGPNAGHS
ncbi:hypothetical protein MPER_13010, partial [Moniliophthora perniciosa FA553]